MRCGVGSGETAMINYGTSFIETEALLAASEQDDETLSHILAAMTQQERARLRTAADRLMLAIEQIEQERE